MADNTTLNAGTGGDVIASDDIGGVKFQRVKIALGADNTNDGDVASGNPMPTSVGSVTPGTGATALGKAIDNPVGATDTGVAALVQRADSLGALTPANGDYVPLRASNRGAIWTVNDNNIVTQVEGGGTHGATAGTRPLLAGGEARTTTPTSVTDGQAVRTQHDKAGRVVTTSGAPRELVTQARITLTATTTETTLLAAGGAGVFHDLTMLVIATSGTTAGTVTIRDSTAGTARLIIPLPASPGGGAVMPFHVPLPQATANNNWTAQCSATITSVEVFVQAVLRA